MSFEGVFERWLSKKTMEGGGKELGRGEKERRPGQGVDNSDPSSEGAVDQEMPVIQREVWEEADMEGMPVLQRMVDIPSVPGGRKLRSPPPPPLQITLSLTDTHVKEKQGKGSKSISHCRDKRKDLDVQLQAGGDESCGSHQRLEKKSHKNKKKTSKVSQAGPEKDSSIPVLKDQPETGEKGKLHHQCHSKSALSELINLSHSSNSPSVPRGLEGDPLLSPERDIPMEPDSTSEFLASISRWQRSRKESEISRGEVSPFGEVSPRSTACVGHTTPSGKEIAARAEENLAECDSTSMFLASPSAISPASQGEIEERVCPVLADREDSNSPAHCVCQCRSLPPPPHLMTRDRPQGAASVVPHRSLTPAAAASTKAAPPIRTCHVKRSHSADDEPAPDLEKVAPSLDLMAAPGDLVQGENDSPPVLTLPEQEIRGKQFKNRHSNSTDIPVDEGQQEAPLLTRYGAESTSHSSGSDSVCDNDDKSPPVLALLGCKDVSSKPSKKLANLFDFTSNIDWNTAVAETVMNPPSLEADGVKKPGIILKIRTRAVVPQVEPKPELKQPTVSQIKRERNTVDNSEMISRLRKRRKPEELKTSVTGEEITERKASHVQCTDSKAKGVVLKASHHKACSSHSSHQAKRQRRNTVQLGEDLTVCTQHLSPADHTFVLSVTKLSRLQSLTHVLVSMLFPRLQPHLNIISPQSVRFTKIIDDILASLECSEADDIDRGCEETREMLEKLSLDGEERAAFLGSARVVLCGSPHGALEEFRDKVCRLLQLLLPHLPVSLSGAVSHSPDELEMLLKKIIMANKIKPTRKNVFA